MKEHYAIAIDGPSGAGKSSLARRIAEHFGFIYVDTGAIYRTVGLAAYRSGTDPKNTDAVATLLPTLEIEMKYNESGEQRMYLFGEDVSTEIRTPEISRFASDVSSLAIVRAFLMDMQRDMAARQNVIMDGRDIGTAVLPGAQLKIFLTAGSRERAQRRLLELQAKGINVSFDDVLRDIEYRDRQDSDRAASPLRAAEDAVTVDTSRIDFQQSFELLCTLVSDRLNISPLVEQ